jgi:queuine tRNA-ribosyltransferase
MSAPGDFSIERADGRARAGVLQTAHGAIQTPVFMPVGTYGTVKAMAPDELTALGAQIVLGNTYHLWLRPGLEVVAVAGGLHKMMGWSGSLLTDSGGFQVFSLSKLSKMSEEGVAFRSPVDGSLRLLTPEVSMEVQAALGSDIAMAFDHCPPGDAPLPIVEDAMARTTRWATRCLAAPRTAGQLRYGIVQGGVHVDLRRRHMAEICALEHDGRRFDGYALGGLSVGEPIPVMYEVLDAVAHELPAARPRYLMGVGTPADLLAGVAAGIDQFDCVMPTRNARNGFFFTSRGRLVIKQARYRLDPAPIDDRCDCLCCTRFSRAYLRHLFQCQEILFSRMATLHNLTYYIRLMREARAAIVEGRFAAFADAIRADWISQPD